MDYAVNFHRKAAFVGFFVSLVLLLVTIFVNPSKQHAANATVLTISKNSTTADDLALQKRSRADFLNLVSHISATTTTTAPTTTTTVKPRPVTTTTRLPVVASPQTGDFWRRLSNCESSTGLGGNGGGYFQFSPDTAAKVGFAPGQSYATQLAEAQYWASRIHPNEGSTSGWPHCWWVALSGK